MSYRVVMPLRAEFGLKLWWFVPAVNALAHEEDERPLVVYHEPGDEALYPGADILLEVPRQKDELRRNRYARDADFIKKARERAVYCFGDEIEILQPQPSWPRKRFVPEPIWRLGINPEVVICPRKRTYGAEKNWPHWEQLARFLRAYGVDVWAAGAPDSSYDVSCPCTWNNSDRFLDASLEAVLNCKLVVATDAGLAHLAVLCGKPLLVITHGEGLVAPGPSSDEKGRVMDEEYWPVKKERYYEANHLGSPIHFLHWSWCNLELVVRTAWQMLNKERRANDQS